MENDNKSTKVIVGVILLVLLVVLGGYTVYQNNQLNDSNTFLEEEKSNIENNLDEMVAKYDAAIAENSSLSDELKLEREDIVLLRDSVKNLKSTNYSLIRRYRNKISSLEASNQELFKQNDSLRIANNILADDLGEAKDSILVQSTQIDTLNIQNLALNEKIGIGAQLKVNTIKVATMKKRVFGDKLVETTRANRTDAMRISFVIAENELADKTQRNAKIQVINPKGGVLNIIGTATTDEGVEFDYSDETSVDYQNNDLGVVTMLELDRKTMLKGDYRVNVYIDNKLVAISGFALN
ncbi:MAG: hypothetical protein COB73_05185 [Flavobacteriaceae bacterium]|nr:MAG: hypothetical protein COB73_05185 [Flavobacteriaceae bacterium]